MCGGCFAPPEVGFLYSYGLRPNQGRSPNIFVALLQWGRAATAHQAAKPLSADILAALVFQPETSFFKQRNSFRWQDDRALIAGRQAICFQRQRLE